MSQFLEWLTRLAQPDLDWGFALRTLMLRFFAVIVVLWMIQLAIQASSALVQWLERRQRVRDDARVSEAEVRGRHEVSPRVVAAIAAALAIEAQPARLRVAERREESAWAEAGRLAQMGD